MLISVAICTYNRADLLDRTLREMTQLEEPAGCDWELLVVDNNSNDSTPAVIERYRDRLPIQALHEGRQGLSNARNCAIDAALGDLLLWTDDDVLVDRHWLAAYAHGFIAYPRADFFGGPVEPWFASTPPDWLSTNFDLFAGAYAVRSAPPGTDWLRDDRLLPFGANFGLRAAAIGERRFDTRLGRIGGALISGEEVQFLSGLLAQGCQGMWLADAPVRHHIPDERIGEAYLCDYYRAKGRSRIRMTAAAERPSIQTVRRKQWKAAWKRLTSRSRASRRWARGFKSGAMAAGMYQELRAPSTAPADSQG